MSHEHVLPSDMGYFSETTVKKTYSLSFTEQDWRDISFVGGRYGWSDWILSNLEPGDNQLSESQAWDFLREISKDTEGGHTEFAMLRGDSELSSKLYAFLENVV